MRHSPTRTHPAYFSCLTIHTPVQNAHNAGQSPRLHRRIGGRGNSAVHAPPTVTPRWPRKNDITLPTLRSSKKKSTSRRTCPPPMLLITSGRRFANRPTSLGVSPTCSSVHTYADADLKPKKCVIAYSIILLPSLRQEEEWPEK